MTPDGMRDTLNGWGLALKNLFMPIFCVGCGRSLLTEENGYFCPACWSAPHRTHRPMCSVCGRPHAERVGFGLETDYPCAECRAAPAPPYRRIYAACDYDGAIAEAIRLLKFRDRPQLVGPLAEELAAFAEREMDCDAYDAIVPVPLHRVRERSRGFNQSALLAEAVAPVFRNAKVDTHLRRIRPTRTQSTISDRTLRRNNVKGAFAVDRAVSFRGETVLLIDDVVTSGGTVGECARALLHAEAAAVDVLAVATPSGLIEDVPAGDDGLRGLRWLGTLWA